MADSGFVPGDFERRYRALQSRDPRFDGRFVVAVKSTGIYCRPSCPAITPRRRNVVFLRTAAAAHGAGFRACLRCRPDAAPGSPDWNMRADLAGRAMRLIADGVVDREGVRGLARRLAYSERHLHRQLVAELGAGPIALARAQRAQTARVMIEATCLPFGEAAFAAGFSSVRQFNDTVRSVFGRTPRQLRSAAQGSVRGIVESPVLRLPYRKPFEADALFRFLAARAIPGVEEGDETHYRRTARFPNGPAVLELRPARDHVHVTLGLSDLRDLAAAVERCRRLLDLDADPVAVDAALGRDTFLRPLVRGAPGSRVPGHVDGAELAVRAVLGQQVSVRAARTLAERLVRRVGEPVATAGGSLTHLFPEPQALAQADLDALGIPAARARTLRRVAELLAREELILDPGADRAEAERILLAIPGVGPWTAGYVAMRALGDPDAFIPTDAGVRRAVGARGRPTDSAAVLALAEAWRPWRAYAVQHLWYSLARPVGQRQAA